MIQLRPYQEELIAGIKKCAVDGCNKPSKCRGWCGTHYTRWARTGSPIGLKRIIYGDIECPIEGCKEKVRENGMCAKHAQRVRRYGDPNYVTPEDLRRQLSRNAQPTLNKVKPTTYKKYLGRHEHRVIAEQMLGRKLKRGEIVHHKDGNKHNNDPANLAVMTQADHINEHRKEMQAAQRAKYDLT